MDKDQDRRQRYNDVMDLLMENARVASPKFIGVDWAADSGYNRGDVIKTENNVVHVRFKTVEVKQ